MNGKQLELGQEVKEYLDKSGNSWCIDDNAVLLKLASENFSRKIGVIYDDRLIIYRDRSKHLMHNSSSYGFNEQVVRTLSIQYIDLYEDTQMFRIPIDVLLNEGEEISLEKQAVGFEKQLFLSIRKIEEYVYVTEDDAKRIELLGEEWFYKLKEEFQKPYMISLGRRISQRRDLSVVFPQRESMFKAYKVTPFSEVRVVIIGQDPYFTPDVADGLAFSSAVPIYLPPSLREIYKAIEKDIHFGLFLDQNPNLSYLAEQGVFLLNRVLTVEKGAPSSHSEFGWQKFTNKTLEKLKDHPKNLVFMLWGNEAKKVRDVVENGRHLILEAEHPANAFRQMRDWDYNECFIKTNKFLEMHGYGTIEW